MKPPSAPPPSLQDRFRERFEAQNPFARFAHAALDEDDLERAAIFADLALAFQQWRMGGHD